MKVKILLILAVVMLSCSMASSAVNTHQPNILHTNNMLYANNKMLKPGFVDDRSSADNKIRVDAKFTINEKNYIPLTNNTQYDQIINDLISKGKITNTDKYLDIYNYYIGIDGKPRVMPEKLRDPSQIVFGDICYGYCICPKADGHLYGSVKMMNPSGEDVSIDYSFDIVPNVAKLSYTTDLKKKIDPDNCTVDFKVESVDNPLIEYNNYTIKFGIYDNGTLIDYSIISNQSNETDSGHIRDGTATINLGVLKGDHKYSLKPVITDGDDKVNNNLPNLSNSSAVDVSTKNRTVLRPSAKGNYAINRQDPAYNNIDADIKYDLVYTLSNDYGKAIPDKEINVRGEVLRTDDNGSITVPLTTNFDKENSIGARYIGDDDNQKDLSQKDNNLIFKQVAGPNQKIYTHVASWGSLFKTSHWTSPNGFSFQKDGNWILAFVAETSIDFYDANNNTINGASVHFKQGSSSDVHVTSVPDNAWKMKITVGGQSSGKHSSKLTGACEAAINYDGVISGSRNIHVMTDMWDSGYTKLGKTF